MRPRCRANRACEASPEDLSVLSCFGSAKEPLWEVSALNHTLEESAALCQPWRKPKKTSLLCPELASAITDLAFVITFVNHLSSNNYMALCSAIINSAVNISECLACRLGGVLHMY